MKIIFLHGMGQSASAWDKVVKELPERDVETLDLFDNGQFPETYHLLETKVRQLLNSIDEEFILVGLSLGACLAFSSLKDRPNNLKGIIACAGQFNLKRNLPFVIQKQVFKLIPKSFFAKQGVDKEKLIEFLSSMSDLNLTDNLIQSEIPALVTCGQKDRFNIKTSQEAASLMPNACFREIPNAGHLLTDDAPQTLANLIEEFLRKNK